MQSIESTTGLERSVAGVYRATPPHWVGDGFRVSTYFPRPGLPAERVSPFLMMDYGGAMAVAPSTGAPRGVGWHPHRGFETVTIAWEGKIAHGDNAGHAGVIGPGDVQWMTAGAGILHKEHYEAGFAREGGTLHMMQLWVNLPRAHKMAPPDYQPIESRDIPAVPLANGRGSVRVIAGEFAGHKGPARTFTPVTLFDVTLAAGGSITVPLAPRHNAMAIVAAGAVRAGAKQAAQGELVLFANDGAQLTLEAERDAHVLLLAGEPLGEPIVSHGPFVMNTRDEIYQALRDFSEGKFGDIPEE